ARAAARAAGAAPLDVEPDPGRVRRRARPRRPRGAPAADDRDARSRLSGRRARAAPARPVGPLSRAARAVPGGLRDRGPLGQRRRGFDRRPAAGDGLLPLAAHGAARRPALGPRAARAPGDLTMTDPRTTTDPHAAESPETEPGGIEPRRTAPRGT